jgi:superfamily II DNA or RNA helicase
MQSPGSLHTVPPRKTPRDGQARVVRAALETSGLLAIRLPTGYGKTFTAAAVFAALWARGDVTRLLYLVPTTAQLRQFCADGTDEFLDAGLEGIVPFDIGYSETLALKKHRQNTCVVFATTIQALAAGVVGSAIREMMQSGSWMVVVDEYHHYGIDRAWGRAARDLPAKFTLAMSATPDRKHQDSAFGQPKVSVRYTEALEQRAVKKLTLHAYEYRIDAITVNGEPISFTTSELAEAAGGEAPDAIDKYIVDNKLRWSPKYISPLVSIPVERLLSRRRGLPLQMLVGAMSCSHAKTVCEQIDSMFGDVLRIDWVGTGPQGRSDAENQAAIQKFCPPKRGGRRLASDIGLDVLVHVGMAGEGLDSVFVSEIVHLNRAAINNQNNQENGRGARRIPDAPEELQHATVSVDSSSDMAAWSGSRVMLLFDTENGEAPPELDEDEQEDIEHDVSELPDEPTVVIANCELQNIDKGDPEVRGCAEAFVEASRGSIGREVLADPEHWVWDAALNLRRQELLQRANGLDGMAVLGQLREQVNIAVRIVASTVARRGSTIRFEKSLIGDLKRRIYSAMKRRFEGTALEDADERGLRERYGWIKSLDSVVRREGVPGWLR